MNPLKLCLLVLLLLLSAPLAAEEVIESFHSDIEVRRNGDLQVTETILVRAEGKSIRRGIFRDFPTRYKRDDGRDLVVGFEVLAVTRDGHTEPFNIKNHANGKRVYIGEQNVFLSPGFYEYKISYLTTRQLGFFDDFDELYWNVTGTGWVFKINQASARVTLPNTVAEFQLAGYTGAQGGSAQNLEYRRTGNKQAYFVTNQPLGRHEGLTIVAGWPKGLINEPSTSQRRTWFFEDNRPSIIAIVGALVLLAYYLVLWRWFGRDPKAGIIIPRYQPPQGYSPASMRFIERMGYDNKCFTTAIINLAVKGVVEIDDDDGSFKVIKQRALNPSLAPGEDQVINGLFVDGGGSISITQSNHSILSKAIGKHKKSLKRDYAKKYFSLNSWLLLPGILLTIFLVAQAIASLPSEEVIFKTLFFSVLSMMTFLMFAAIWRGLSRRGKSGIFRAVVNIIALLVFGGFFITSGIPFTEFAEVVPLPLVGGVIAMLAMHYLFYHWLKAPTLAGRRLLDRIEGFKHYLEVAEKDEIALQGAPRFSADLYETYLPYAIALDLENQWTAKLNRAIATGLIESHYSHPHWYHTRNYHGSEFSSALSVSFNSAIASSSVAPGSSSGSSGGSSGGGGGGGGGGGW
jgi:uncharacterized membrane protein YgcG